MPRDIDQAAKDLLQQIFVQEPNLRLSLGDMRNHRFFSEIDWRDAETRQLSPVPYKPNPMKYRYLLSNKYEQLSSLATATPSHQEKRRATLTSTQMETTTPESLDASENTTNVELEKVPVSKNATTVRNESPTKRNLLGDLTIYRINKEFENF